MDKVERYDWAEPGNRGEWSDIALAELRIDRSYQRGEVSEDNTLAIARGLNWKAFGSLVVMRRRGGNLYVVDGGQRLNAIRRRGDIKTAPCRVFPSSGPAEEALAFLMLNSWRKNVSAFIKFRAACKAGREPERTINKFVVGINRTITGEGKDPRGISFARHLVDYWKLDAEDSQKSLRIQASIIGNEPMHSSLHKGIWWLLHVGKVNVQEHVDSLRRKGGLAGLLRAIKTVCIETGQSASAKICGMGVLRQINQGKRGVKVRASEDESEVANSAAS